MSGLLTDELQDVVFGGDALVSGDDRQVISPTIGDGKNVDGYAYDVIQIARVDVRQALQALQLYGNNVSGVPRAWQGEMYAMQGYTVVWLAELFCSGVPLSQSALIGSQVPTRGLTTEELLRTAVALFDSAVVAGADSAQYVNLALVGKGRALLDLGEFAAADSAVRNVPTDFVYALPTPNSGNTFSLPTGDVPGVSVRVQDREGSNGLVWSTDPRTGVATEESSTGDMLRPAKYNMNPSTNLPDPDTWRPNVPIRVADGLEARLIQAEAQLALGSANWLTILNTLRSTCIGTAACAPIIGLTASSLPPLADPGPATRLDTLMKERAMWLYLTGHREGDLRRMAHVYGRDPETLWPTGTFLEPGFPSLNDEPGPQNGTLYGSDVVYAPDINEHARNPNYRGCYDTNP